MELLVTVELTQERKNIQKNLVQSGCQDLIETQFIIDKDICSFVALVPFLGAPLCLAFVAVVSSGGDRQTKKGQNYDIIKQNRIFSSSQTNLGSTILYSDDLKCPKENIEI